MEKRTSLILLFLLSTLFMAAAGSGAILNVPADYDTLQAAVDAAYEGDEVVLSVGTYTGDGNCDIDPNGKSVTIRSTKPNEPNIVAATVIDCNGSEAEPHRAFYFNMGEDANSILNGLTIINGYAHDGGGIYCAGGGPTITNCTFSGNSAERWGGAMYNNGSSPVITKCTFVGNLAERYGGAMFNMGSNSTITNCTFGGNSAASSGGAVINYSDDSVITNCIFSGNRVEEWGGAIYNVAGDPAVINCTFSGNRAGLGGAIHNYYSDAAITSCILWGDGPQEVFNQYSNAIITYSDVKGGWEGEGNIDIDPLFADPCNGDYHLFEDSLCIDAGDPNYAAGPNETDLDGNPRIIGERVDMGAYELQALIPDGLLLELVGYINELGLHKGITNSLRAKLEAANRLLEDGDANNDVTAINLLNAFINAVRAQKGKKIPEAEADILIEIAEEIIWFLGG